MVSETTTATAKSASATTTTGGSAADPSSAYGVHSGGWRAVCHALG